MEDQHLINELLHAPESITPEHWKSWIKERDHSSLVKTASAVKGSREQAVLLHLLCKDEKTLNDSGFKTIKELQEYMLETLKRGFSMANFKKIRSEGEIYLMLLQKNNNDKDGFPFDKMPETRQCARVLASTALRIRGKQETPRNARNEFWFSMDVPTVIRQIWKDATLMPMEENQTIPKSYEDLTLVHKDDVKHAGQRFIQTTCFKFVLEKKQQVPKEKINELVGNYCKLRNKKRIKMIKNNIEEIKKVYFEYLKKENVRLTKENDELKKENDELKRQKGNPNPLKRKRDEQDKEMVELKDMEDKLKAIEHDYESDKNQFEEFKETWVKMLSKEDAEMLASLRNKERENWHKYDKKHYFEQFTLYNHLANRTKTSIENTQNKIVI